MRPWLLLVSLLVSDLSPLGDGDWVMENYRWCLCRKRLLDGQMTLLGLEILQTQTERHCMCIQRNCVCVAVQHKQRTCPFYWTYRVHDDRGYKLSHQEFTELIHRNHIPALVVYVLHGGGEIVPAFLVKSDTLPALRGSEIPPTNTGGEARRIAVDLIKGHPDSGWLLHAHTAASGHNIQALLLKKSKSWVPVTAATTVVISCCFKEDEISQHDIFHTLHSGSSSDASQLNIQRNAVRTMKTNEHLNLDEESLFQKSVQKQHSLKAAFSVYDNDGFNVEKKLFLVSREKTESKNRPQYKIKATQDDNKEDFIITTQADGESEPQQSHTNTIEKGHQKRLAYVLQADFTQETDNNDVDRKQMLAEVGEEVLIMLLPPDTETETHRKLLLNTDTGWKTENTHMKELDEPRPMTKATKENLSSKCKCVKESHFSLEINALVRTQRTGIKPAERTATVTTVSEYTEDKIKETTEETEHTHTNNTPQDVSSINHTEQEEETISPSPPSVMITETAKTEHIAETTAVTMEIKETRVFSQGSTRKADGPPSTEETPTTTMRSEMNDNIEATAAPTERSLSGLRMREDVPAADTPELPEGTENGQRAATNTTDDHMPLCRGLIHRTEAGWKHCVQRFAGMGSNVEETEHRDHDYDHFYYFDGVLRRVQNYLYPYYKRQSSRDNIENSDSTVRKKENLLGYIRRLTLKNRASHFK